MGVGHAVGKHRADIGADVKRIHDRLVKRNEAVLRACQRTVDIEENQPLHEQSRFAVESAPFFAFPSVSIPVSICLRLSLTEGVAVDKPALLR